MKVIGVYTKDFSLSHDIVEGLKRRDIDFIHIQSLRSIPHRVGVVVTSSLEGKDVKGKKTVFADLYKDIDDALDRAIEMLHGDGESIVLGIDPGEYPGIALMSGESVIRTWCADSIGDALDIIKRVLDEFSDKRVTLKIGHDARIYRDRIIEKLVGLNVDIQIVDETKTSQKVGLSRKERNEVAAIRIARSDGKILRVDGHRKFTDGEIREIQRKSRMMSGGRVTISRNLALKVLEGKITIEEALKINTL